MGHEIAPSLVIEEHLFGSVYRATVIDKKLVGFFRADPPRVTGDGTHTVSELIEKQNAAKHEKIQNITVTDDVRSFIARKGYALDSILPAGLVLDLTAKTGRFLGGYTKEMLPEVHPKMHEIFARAGKTAEIGIAGFDLIIPDPTQDPDTQVWGIIECNSLPFIDLHYYALEGTPINLAKNIWDVWEKKYPSHSQTV
jgi:cyanophycin synthetase